jgi:hypothetical protein
MKWVANIKSVPLEWEERNAARKAFVACPDPFIGPGNETQW